MSEPWCCHIDEDGTECPAPAKWAIWAPSLSPGRYRYDGTTHSCSAHFEVMGGFEGESVPIEHEREMIHGGDTADYLRGKR